MSKPKFCTFCGSESDNAPLAAMHKEMYDEYQQVSAILALQIELLDDILEVEGDSMSKEDVIEQVKFMLVEEREKVIGDKEYRENKFQTTQMLFSLGVESK